MDVISTCPLRVAAVTWRPTAEQYALTLVCKATYRLEPDLCPLHSVQLPATKKDRHWTDAPQRSLYVPSDLVPGKAHADVVLVGRAIAPGAVPARSIVTRLRVGGVDKRIEVFGHRFFTPRGELVEQSKLIEISLWYERASGGARTNNPVGVAPGARDEQGRVMLPNLQPAGLRVDTPQDLIPPIGYGPIAPTWPERREKLGKHARSWNEEKWWTAPLPKDFDLSFFNVAPIDQRLDEIRAEEPILLENLVAGHPRLDTRLPGLRPCARLVRSSGQQEKLSLEADTLWIDTSRGICTVTWRAQAMLSHLAEQGRVEVSLEQEPPDDDETLPGPMVRRPGVGLFAADATMPPAPRDVGLPFFNQDPDGGATEPTIAVGVLLARVAEGQGRVLGQGMVLTRPTEPVSNEAAPGPAMEEEPEDVATLARDPATHWRESSRARERSVAPLAGEPRPMRAHRPPPDPEDLTPLSFPSAATLGRSALPFRQSTPPPSRSSRGAPAQGSVPPPSPSARGSLPAPPPSPSARRSAAAAGPRPSAPASMPAPPRPRPREAPHHAEDPLPFRKPPQASPLPPRPSQAQSSAQLPFLPQHMRESTTAEPVPVPRPSSPWAQAGRAGERRSVPPSHSTSGLFTNEPLGPNAEPPKPPPLMGPLATAEMVEREALQAGAAPPAEPEPAPAEPPVEAVQPAAPVAEPGPIPIEQCGALAASLARRPEDASKILDDAKLTPEQWKATEALWADRVRAETGQGRAQLLRTYDAAYVARLEQERGPIEVEEYARLVVAAERGQSSPTLRELGLPTGAMVRIERVFLRRLVDRPTLGDRVRKAVEAQRNK